MTTNRRRRQQQKYIKKLLKELNVMNTQQGYREKL